MTDPTTIRRIHIYCALCIARCGAVAVVDNGRFTRLEPDPSHPTGQALCAKGRAAPELVYHRERLTRPLRRTRPKGDPDPGWEPVGWDEALDARFRARACTDLKPKPKRDEPSLSALGGGEGRGEAGGLRRRRRA